MRSGLFGSWKADRLQACDLGYPPSSACPVDRSSFIPVRAPSQALLNMRLEILLKPCSINLCFPPFAAMSYSGCAISTRQEPA